MAFADAVTLCLDSQLSEIDRHYRIKRKIAELALDVRMERSEDFEHALHSVLMQLRVQEEHGNKAG